MPLSIVEIHEDVSKDDAIKELTGMLGSERFNRASWRASLKLLDWLSGGSVKAEAPPSHLQKSRDFLSPFLKKYSTAVYSGLVTKPVDYYLYESMYLLRADRSEIQECSDEDEIDEMVVLRQPIEILTNDKFAQRMNSWIEEEKPTLDAPICKLTTTGFEFYPKDVGNIELEYVKYPVRGVLRTKQDDVYNAEVPDASTSINYDFGENVRNHLVWFIVQQLTLPFKDRQLLELNTVTKP